MTYKTSKILLASSMIMLLALVPLQAAPAASATSASTGIVIPLYSFPYTSTPCHSSTCFFWNSVNTTKNNHPHVPLFVIINPNNGPGTSRDSNYAQGIANLTKSGIVVLGYVFTSYGARSTATVEADIDSYKNWYQANGLKGIMFDEMANTAGHESYYSTLTSYAKTTDGFKYTQGNPGTSTLTSYIGTEDTLNIFENSYQPALSTLQSSTFVTGGYDKHNFSFLSYNQASLPSQDRIGNYSNFVAYMYLTPDNLPNPWDTIASYLSTLAAYLDHTTATITIKSVDSTGSPITGYFVAVKQNNTQIPSGFTPLAYNGTTGVRYHFIPNSFGGCNFNHWQDTGSTTADRAILVNSTSATFTAVYSGTCGGSSGNIVLNSVKTTSGTVSTSPYQITLSSFNAGTGTNRVLVVGVEANNQGVNSITFGGIALTKATSSFTNNDAEFWYLKNPTGTANIVVTMAGSTSVVVGAYAFSGVDQTNPIPTTATNHNTAASSPTISITTANANSWVLDSPSIYGGKTLGSPTCTQQWDINIASAITGASSSKTQASPGSVTCSWTASPSGDLWDDVAVELKSS